MVISVVFLEGPAAISEALRVALADFTMIRVERAATGEPSLQTCHDRSTCQVLVADLDPSGPFDRQEGIDTLTKLREQQPQSRIVVHTLIDNPAAIGKMMTLGVSSVVSKQDGPRHVIAGILGAASGGRYLSPNALGAMQRIEDPTFFSQGCHLSRREAEVMRFYMSGASVSEIARRVDRSVKTISSQKSSAMRKLGIGREIDLYRHGRLSGL